MKLIKFNYSEYLGLPLEWKLDETNLFDINLLVGVNASGKSRTLNTIVGLSRLLLEPQIIFIDGQWVASFEHNSDIYVYHLQIKNSAIKKEMLYVNDKIYIDRHSDGTGYIHSVQTKGRLNFKIPINQLIAFRRDEIQYPYLENLFNWASKLRHFRFAKEKENKISILQSNKAPLDSFNLKETDQSNSVFRIAFQTYGEKFSNSIIEDLNSIGYSIEDVSIGNISSLQESGLPLNIQGLNIKEKDIKGKIDFINLSDGMFRALSILIHFNFYKIANLSGTVLIDDIGEGLDFSRSTGLINLLIKKAQETNIQLIMSTNDKFVMNNTSLDYWQLIERKGQVVKSYNKLNSGEIFEEFKYTGLNNFDFYSTDFFKTGLK